MQKILLSPPVVFVLLLAWTMMIASLLSHLSFKPSKRQPDTEKSYACGEDVPTHLMQPDYSQFFPFAFFFTILHVITLMIATVPVETLESFSIAVIYIIGAITGLVILFRR
jgi:NADH:ubiquinone oxidoreductase subunit 3 (subunit A)